MKVTLLLSLLFWGALLLKVRGATFTVDRLDDQGAGSLRNAIAQANTTIAPDRIIFAEGLSGVITLSSTLSVTAPLEIQGPGRQNLIIDGDESVRVFNLTGSSRMNPHRLQGITIQNGRTFLGGANIRAIGSIQLIDCTLRGGHATAINGNGNNSQNADGGALFHSGGALLIDSCLFEENQTIGGFSQGGAIYTENGDGSIINTRITENTTNGLVAEGGGLASRSILTVENCEITGNETLASSSGGGGIYTDDTIIVRQCTISGNIVGASPGTGISGYSVGGAFANVGSSPATFESCTITQNSAPHGVGQGAGISSLSRGIISFSNCIVAGNIGMADLDETPNRVITYQDLGHNLFGIVTPTNLNQTGNQASTSLYNITNPELSELGFYGGITRTQIPFVGSPALDVGLPNLTQTYDQRGIDFPRLVGSRADIGATERQTFIDSDTDGIPDAIEALVPNLSTSSGDLDGDGISDFREYALLGTAAISNPQQRPSLGIEEGNGTWILNFPHSPNREYRLVFNNDLTSALTPVVEDYTQFNTQARAQLSAPDVGTQGFFFLESRVIRDPIP